jgi:hypothetical protein
VFFGRDFFGIIGNQIKLWFFWKGSVIEVGGPGGAVASIALPLSHVSMNDYHTTVWVGTNHASLRSIALQHASMHVAVSNSLTQCFPNRKR